MARNQSHPLQMPGAAAPEHVADEAQDAPTTGETGGTGRAAELEAENARLRALLSLKDGNAGQPLVEEGIGPHNRTAIAESKHYHLTCAELAAEIKAGKAHMEPYELKVLCRDGWFMNPGYKQHQG